MDINTTDPGVASALSQNFDQLAQEIQVQLQRIDQTNVHLTEVFQEQAKEQARTFRGMCHLYKSGQRLINGSSTLIEIQVTRWTTDFAVI